MSGLDGPFSNYQFDPQSYRVDDRGAPYRGGILGPLGPSWWGAGLDLPTQAPTGFPAMSSGASASPRTAQGAASPQTAESGFGRTAGPQNPFMGLLSSVGDAVGGLFGGARPQSPASPGTSQPTAAPGLLDRLTAGATNLTTGGNPIAGLLNAVNGLATGQRTDRAGLALAQQQGMMQALMNMGVAPDMARAAAINPDVLRTIVAARRGGTPTAQPAVTAPRAAADRFAGTQPGRMPPAGANAATPPAAQVAQAQQGQPLVRVATPTEAARLPSGTRFIDPTGKERVVP
jgi:hypothetical protein